MAITATRKWLVDDLPLIIDSLSQQRQREEEEPLQPPGSRRFMCRPGGDRLSLTATDAAHARSSSAAQTVRCAVAHLHIPNFHPSAQCCHSFDSIHFSENFSFEKKHKKNGRGPVDGRFAAVHVVGHFDGRRVDWPQVVQRRRRLSGETDGREEDGRPDGRTGFDSETAQRRYLPVFATFFFGASQTADAKLNRRLET